MKIVKINSKKPENEKIELAKKALKNGGIIVYPTDTVYGIGANIFDEKAVQKVYSAKRRSQTKPISICLSKIEDIKEVACIDRVTERIARKILPGPFTLILNKKKDILPLLTAGKDKIGVRIPDSSICKKLSEDFPITTTSANISGMKVPESVDGVVKQLGNSVDLILDAGVFEHAVPSTVVDMTIFPPKILRKGSKTSFNEIFK